MLISAIIPTVNEERRIGRCIESLLRNEPPLEILVVDGGSTDRTVELARSFGEPVRVLSSRPGRAAQMNVGATAAGGVGLWFIHADSVVPPTACARIRRRLADERVALGAFRFAFHDAPADSLFLRLVEAGTHFRSLTLRLPFGDQGLFLRRDTFWSIGGYRDVPLLEDLLLVRAARRLGAIVIEKVAVLTSARRWTAAAWPPAVSIRHGLIMLGHALGVPPHRLLRLRGAGRSQQRLGSRSALSHLPRNPDPAGAAKEIEPS